MIAFINTKNPCVDNEITRWHLRHGWLYNAYRIPANQPVGVFYATLLCGDGAVIHFDVIPEARLSPLEILHGFRKGIRLIASALPVVFATIPEEKHKLIRCIERLGFVRIPEAGYLRDGEKIAVLKLDLLKFLVRQKNYSIPQPKRRIP